jgi:hypothetical protein
MGRVSICAQWLIIGSGVLLSPLFVLFMAGVIGRSLLRKLWRAVRRAHQPGCEQGGVAAPPAWAGPDGLLDCLCSTRKICPSTTLGMPE